MPAPRLLAFAGSTRTESLNKKLARVAAGAAREAGADVTLIDLRDHALPLYDGDLEAADGLPANAMALKTLFAGHDGLLLACPEYNSSMTGVFKNTIDWVSRPAPGEKGLPALEGKVAGLLAASPGALGGLRCLVHVRAMLSNLGVLVIPQQHALSRAGEAFGPDGALVDPKQQAAVARVAAALVDVTARMRPGAAG